MTRGNGKGDLDVLERTLEFRPACCACRVHFMDAPLEELMTRAAARNRLSGREPVFTISPEKLREWAASFEAPDEDELGL